MQDVSLIIKSFDDIWDQLGFSDIFANINKDDFYSNITPCNTCNHLKERCFSCPAQLMVTGGSNKSELSEYSCDQYSQLIQAHYAEDDCKLKVTNQIIREAVSNDESYTLFNTETFETLSLNKEAYMIWNELKLVDVLQYSAAVRLIRSKYTFTDSEVKEVINYLIECNYLKKVA